MFEDYRKKVKIAYDQMKKSGEISMNLMHPTAAKLRDECIIVYRQRGMKKDGYIIKSFFGPLTENNPDYGQIIKNFEVDKFRPLQKFLIKGTTIPVEKNIELLAWLIDFELRPSSIFGSTYTEFESQKTSATILNLTDENTCTSDIDNELISGADSSVDEIEDKKLEEGGSSTSKVGDENIMDAGNEIQGIQTSIIEIKKQKKTASRSIIWKAIFCLFIILTASGGAYLFSDDRPQQCMYWTGDHYQPISCNKKIDNTAIIALDTVKLNHLKRITEPDTITGNSLGKVWYTKVDGEVEFYTESGYHPLDDNKRLMPITVYMINKYIRRK